MGKALRNGYRDKVFLMTEVDGCTKQTAESQLAESLQRLQTDHPGSPSQFDFKICGTDVNLQAIEDIDKFKDRLS